MRVARVNGVIDRSYVEPSDEELGDRLEAARARCSKCADCGGVGFIEMDRANGVESGFCPHCKGRGFVNDDPVLDDVVRWVCDACEKDVIVHFGYLEVDYCWHCRMPYSGAQEQLAIPLRTIDPITGDRLPDTDSEARRRWTEARYARVGLGAKKRPR